MQTQSKLVFDAQRTQSLIANRAIVKNSQVGQTVRFHIVGNGNLVPVKTKDGVQVMDNATNTVPLYKTIYNVKANSQLAMQNPRNQQILREAMQAESVGEVDKAHELFNSYLNKIQVSFSIIQNPGRSNVQFYDKQLVEGEVELVTTENGQLITMTNVRAVAVEKLAATPAFSLADLMGIVDEANRDSTHLALHAENVFTDDNKVGEGADKAEA